MVTDAFIAHLAKVTAEENATTRLPLHIGLEDPTIDRRPEPPAPAKDTGDVDFEIDSVLPL